MKTCPRGGKDFVPGSYQRRMIYCSKNCRKPNDERCRETYARHRERYKAGMRARYSANPEYYRARSAAYYRENREEQLELGRARFQRTRRETPWEIVVRNAAERSRKKGYAFNLTAEWAQSRWTGCCEITGVEFVFGKGPGPRIFSPTLDRIDPVKGYVQDNCRIVIQGVNGLKADGTDSDMVMIAEAIVIWARTPPR
jgi:hypothetical protein